MITQHRLKEVLSYDPITGDFLWKDYPLPSGKKRRRHGSTCVGSIAGNIDNSTGYIRIRYDGILYHAHRLAWPYTYGEWPSNEIDHINGTQNDNRLINLRPANRRQQCANTRINARNKVGMKGVCRTRNGRYAAYIKINGKSKYLGAFDTPEEAHLAYQIAAMEAHGEFARW